MENKKSKYDDIISLPRPVSKKHPPMPIEARAAQFTAFAALTGYHEQIREASRYTVEKKELDESSAETLNNKMIRLRSSTAGTETEITYFIPDNTKSGGKYMTVKGYVTKFDDINRRIILSGAITVPYDDITDIKTDEYL